MITMKYTPKVGAGEVINGLPMHVELEEDEGFHVSRVWLVIAGKRYECAYVFSSSETPSDR